MKRPIIKSGKTMLFICRDQLPPIGYRTIHGMQLTDKRWLFEIEKDYRGSKYGNAFKKHTGIIKIP